VTKNAHYIKELLQWSVLEIWLFTCSSLKLDLYLLLCIKINSKWIRYLNIRPEMLKLL
jgi:hypothetical protein